MERRQNDWSDNMDSTQESGEKSHGNTGLPFGLCKKYGIELPKNATPRMAWNALKDRKGVFPPWTKKGQSSGIYSEEESKEKLQISDNINEYAANIIASKKTSDWQKKAVATAIGKVNEMVPTEKLKTINLTNRATSYRASACGDELNVSSKFLRETEGSPNIGYSEDVIDYQRKQKEYKEMYTRWANESSSEEYKQMWAQKAEEAGKFARWSVQYEDDSVSTTIYHELGHVVADQYFGLLNGDLLLVGGKSAIVPAVGRAIIKQAYRESKKNGEIYKVSEYGAKDVHEFFAESFAMYIAEEEQLPPTIAKMFKELKL